MAQKNRQFLPSSMGGLVRYFDDYKSKIEIKPGVVVFACIAVIVIVVILQAFGAAWLQ
jgi:preprotein translocase subunit Sec61beta